MYGMFYGCYNLTTIYVSDLWSIDAVTNSTYMFHACSKLKSEKGTVYSSTYRDATYARIDDPDNDKPGYFTYKASPQNS